MTPPIDDLAAFHAARRAEAALLDVETCLIDWDYGDIGDPYDVAPRGDDASIGRVYFAHNDAHGSPWVEFNDLSEAQRERLWKRIDSGEAEAEKWRPDGLDDFIAERHAEGHRYVIIDQHTGCVGWSKTIDGAWADAERRCAEWAERAKQQGIAVEDAITRVMGSECYFSIPNGARIETYAQMINRRAVENHRRYKSSR